MPRKEREHSETGIYHVMLRGINRQDIFDEEEDYWAFIRALSSIQYRLEDDQVTRICTCHIYAEESRGQVFDSYNKRGFVSLLG